MTGVLGGPARGNCFGAAPLGVVECDNSERTYSVMIVSALTWPDVGFQGKNAGKFEQYQLAEIKHSRLAMLAFSGFAHQYFATKQGVFEQLGNFKALEGAAGPFTSDKVLGQIF